MGYLSNVFRSFETIVLEFILGFRSQGHNKEISKAEDGLGVMFHNVVLKVRFAY